MSKMIPLFLVFSSCLSFAVTAPISKSIQGDMQVISENYGKLGRQLGNSKLRDSSRQIVNRMLDASADAQMKTPPAAEKLQGQEREDIIKKYQADVQGMIDHLTALRNALATGDDNAARSNYEALKPWTKPDHAQLFQ